MMAMQLQLVALTSKLVFSPVSDHIKLQPLCIYMLKDPLALDLRL